MKIAVNGLMPTIEQLEALSKLVPTRFSLGDWKEYEENIEWDNMCVVYPTGDVLRCASYTGLWELLTLEKRWALCSDELKVAIHIDLIDDLLYHFKDEQVVEAGEIELFEEPEININ